MSEMGKAMMGTGEAAGDNRAIEAAEKAISNPLLDGVSMRGAKGVIISITGGEDMRLMEVDEAANHIKELVDPDANIIWGSAFNNDLDGKIRVSVVATGIEAEEGKMAEPAKLFTFPAKTKVDAPSATAAAPAPVSEPQPVAEAAPAPVVEENPVEIEAAADAGDTFELDESLIEPEPEIAAAPPPPVDELLLGDEAILTSPPEPNPVPPSDASGTRSWLSRSRDAQPEETAKAAKPKNEGGTLFERMSSLARGASKAQVDESSENLRSRDPLDIPRFLNRQNNP
jgi:cell division protein FtsZ